MVPLFSKNNNNNVDDDPPPLTPTLRYIYRAWKGDEQLFNLTADPLEMTEISRDPTMASTLSLWRGRLVAQFEREGRGKAFVDGGKLVKRGKQSNYSPNYPKQL